MFISTVKLPLKRYVLIVITTILLFGCAQLPDDSTNVEWQQHQQRLTNLKHYKATGKLGFISPEERRSMTFFWQQEEERTQLRLTSLFGQTLLKLTMTPEETSIETYLGDQFQAADGASLLYQLTGLVVPLEQLPQWLKGAVTIDIENNYTLLETNTLASQTTSVAERTWQVDYLRYSDITDGDSKLPLPSLLKLTQDDIKINLQITKWTIE
ncbi:lipoprotein insertase outer membrane protein LolB [Vibrio sp. WJH972]